MENQLSQARAPIFEALRAFSKERVVPFDVPGHKHGKGNPELTEFRRQVRENLGLEQPEQAA